MKTPLVASLALMTLASTGVAMAARKTFSATLSGDGGTSSPVETEGTGTAVFTVDDGAKTICGTITYSHLSGDPTAMHIHRGGATEADGGIVQSFSSSASPVKVSFTNVGATKLAQLMSGETYFDIHTATYPDGEIRGQLRDGGEAQTCETIVVDAGSDAGDAAPAGSFNGLPDENASSTTPPGADGTSTKPPASKHDDGGCAAGSSPSFPLMNGLTAALGAGFALAAMHRRRRKHHRGR